MELYLSKHAFQTRTLRRGWLNTKQFCFICEQFYGSGNEN